MKVNHLFLSLALAPLVLAGCDSDDAEARPAPALVIGDNYGECAGDCARLFLIADRAVYPDDGVVTAYGNSYEDWDFRAEPLTGVDPLLVDSLLTMIPEDIDALPAEAFGAPDAGDWGALPLVIVGEDGGYDRYTLDNATHNMDERLRPYGELMQQAVRAWSE